MILAERRESLKDIELGSIHMGNKSMGSSWVHRILMLLVLINILGDIGNIASWYSNPDSRISLNGGIIASFAGTENALAAGTIILAVVVIIYVVALSGLFKKMKWAALLVIAISVVNRVLALFIFAFGSAYAFWAVWTIILVIFAFLDYRQLSTLQTKQQA